MSSPTIADRHLEKLAEHTQDLAVLNKDDAGALSNDDDEEKLDEVFQLGFDQNKNCTFSAILRTL